jgi:hypothetical protein
MNKTLKLGPDFLCIGMQKGGTQWIYDAMSMLPGVFMPPIKEMNHFAVINGKQKKQFVDATIRRRMMRLSEEYPEVPIALRRRFRQAAVRYMADQSNRHYRQLFCMADGKYTGDVSPIYSLLSTAEVRKVHKAFPDLPIVFSIRHPVSRAWSHFNMQLRKDMAIDGLTEDQMHGEIRVRSTPEAFAIFIKKPRTTQLSSGSVAYDSWIAYYKNILVVDFNDIALRPASVICRLSKELLGVAMQEDQAPVVPNVKETAAKAKIGADHTEIGLQHFKDEIARCKDRFAFCASWEG